MVKVYTCTGLANGSVGHNIGYVINIQFFGFYNHTNMIALNNHTSTVNKNYFRSME